MKISFLIIITYCWSFGAIAKNTSQWCIQSKNIGKSAITDLEVLSGTDLNASLASDLIAQPLPIVNIHHDALYDYSLPSATDFHLLPLLFIYIKVPEQKP